MQLSYLTPLQNCRHAGSVQVRAAAFALLLLVDPAATAYEPTIPPDFAVATRAVEAYFTTLPDYRAGDLVSRSHVAAALVSVEHAGWKVPGSEEIVQRTLPDNSFLVARFATPAGRRFMRRLSGEPGAYARLDRLSSISRGQTLINGLIRQKGGDELVRYLATEKGGRMLGQQMSATRRGVDLNKPTGRIYTADDLIAALKQLSL